MVLADTSVWIDHFREGRSSAMASLLTEGLIVIHPFVVGELACGNLKHRTAVLKDLRALSPAIVATNAEAFQLLEDRRLWGGGLGWVDIHLLASALISHCRLWTLDRRLAEAAAQLSLEYRDQRRLM
jgi:predicted nucleic acid-binding protein